MITGRSAGADWADRISQYVRSNYADPSLNAKKIASRFGLNPAYVSDMFHKSTGMKLLDYIHNVRLEHIRDMLENTSLSLPEIASITGYYDRYAMSRVFSRYIGCPPSEYRKK